MKFRTLVILLVVAKVALHLAIALFAGYGIFRDELYYLANTAHPAFGYVDHPPLSIWVLGVFTWIFGDSLIVLRTLTALLGGAAMWSVLKMTRTLGGNLIACWLAGIAFLFAPINLAYTSSFSMNIIEVFLWPLAIVLLIRALRHPEVSVHWLWVGFVTGLGMMNKISMAWFAIGLMVFLLISPYRNLLRQKGPYLAGATALLLFLPFILWNLANDMAHLEFASNASQFKYAGISRVDFLAEQLLLEHPLILIFLVASLLFLFSRSASWIERLPLVLFFTALVILLMKGQVKANYMASAYTGIMACGAIWLSRSDKTWQRGLLGILSVVYIVTGLILMPLATPVLSEEAFINYNKALGVGPSNQESKEEGPLPQYYADMHGWENFARTVSEAYLALTDEEREGLVAWVNNYGEAGAIDYYRDEYPLPPVLSRHNAYFTWGMKMLATESYDKFLIVGGEEESHKEYLSTVREMNTIRCTYCMPYENNLPVYFARDPRTDLPLIELFRSQKNFN